LGVKCWCENSYLFYYRFSWAYSHYLKTTAFTEPLQVSHWSLVPKFRSPPPAAWSAHFGGTVQILVRAEHGVVERTEVRKAVVRSQSGKVLDDSQKLSAYLVEAAKKNLATWRFSGDERGSFQVTFTYSIQGSETSAPESPIVKLELPTTVTIIARPFKPTTTH